MKTSLLFSAWSLLFLLCSPFSLQAKALDSSISLQEPHIEHRGDLRLHLEEMASLPGGLVLLGGSLLGPSGVSSPALLISRDSGSRWHTYSLDFEGAGVRMIRTAEVESLWVLLTDRSEGADYPTHLLRSDDGGEHWRSIALTLDALKEPVVTVASLEVSDRQFGLLALKGSLGGQVIYETRDGGMSWQVLWKRRPENLPSVAQDYLYPEQASLPLHAPLWQKIEDHYRINGLLRVMLTEDVYAVERFSFDNDGRWKGVSRIQSRQ